MSEIYSKILQISSLSFLVLGLVFFIVGYFLNNRDVTISTIIEKPGEVAAYSTFISESFPRDIFFPPDSDIRTINKNSENYFIVFETQESENLLKQKFAGEMKKQGWRLQDNTFIKNNKQVSLDTVLDENQKDVVGFLKLSLF